MGADAAGRRHPRLLFGPRHPRERQAGGEEAGGASPRRRARARIPTIEVAYEKSVRASFLVAAYRRPDFRVDVKLTSASAKAGEPVKAAVSAKYLFGAAMPVRPATWTWTRSPASAAPAAVYDALPDGDRWEFVGSVERQPDDVAGDEPGSEDHQDRRAEPGPPDQARCRRALRLHARGGRRGRVAAAHREPRHRSPSIPPTGTSASGGRITSSIRKPVSRPNWSASRRPGR